MIAATSDRVLPDRPTGTRGTTGTPPDIRRLPARLALTVLALLSAGCSPSEPAPGEEDRPLRIALSSDVVSLDPHLHAELSTGSVLVNAYDALTAFDADMRLLPELAESWENPDELTWRFRLRSGVVFHDGTRLTARDVVASLDRARQHPESRVAPVLVAVDSVEAPDDATVIVRTTEPYPLLANKLTIVRIVPRDSPERIESPNGTGPYRFVERRPGESLLLSAAPRSWRPSPAWKALEYRVVPSESEQVRRLLAGELDLVPRVPPTLADEIETAGNATLLSRLGLDTRILGVHHVGDLADLRVRRAIDLAIDRESIVETVLRGRGVPTGQLVSRNVFGHVAGLEAGTRDLETARQLLREAGVLRPELRLDHPPEAAAIAGILADQVAEAGIDLVPVARPWNEIYERISAGDYELFLARYDCGSGDASDLLDAVLHTRQPERGYGAANVLAYSNPELDRLIEAADQTLSWTARGELLTRAVALASEDLAMIPLWQDRALVGLGSGIRWTPRIDQAVLAIEIGRAQPGG